MLNKVKSNLCMRVFRENSYFHYFNINYQNIFVRIKKNQLTDERPHFKHFLLPT